MIPQNDINQPVIDDKSQNDGWKGAEMWESSYLYYNYEPENRTNERPPRGLYENPKTTLLSPANIRQNKKPIIYNI